MGFFSSIKNFFGKASSNKPEPTPAKTETTAVVDLEDESRKGQPEDAVQETVPQIKEIDNHDTVSQLPKTEIEESKTKLTTDFEKDEIPEFQPGAETIAESPSLADEIYTESPTDIEKSITVESPSAGEIADAHSEEKKTDRKDEDLLVRLRAADPRLSVWLDIALENVEVADDLFWERLTYLLKALEAPENEISSFTADFKNWLNKMEYWHLDEFRSELQYRLALALDLEDEEDERNRLLLKLRDGLAKTRETLGRQLDQIFASHGELDDKFWNELEELLIMSDMGYETSLAMVERLKERARKNRIKERSSIKDLLFDEMTEIFNVGRKIQAVNKPEVILMSGVNGAGKTTTIAKLANRMRMQGKKTLVVAADTFRAAAIEQLQVWAERAGALFYAKNPGADPAAVAWEGLDLALHENVDVVFIDTAGRLQTKTNLMEELGKIRQVLAKKHPGSPHRSILVLDATTGQNALSQAKLFREAAGVDELILTKIDGTAKGGVALAVAMQEQLPISFVGLGEKMEDLRPFNGEDYAHALLEDTMDKRKIA